MKSHKRAKEKEEFDSKKLLSMEEMLKKIEELT